MLVYFVSQNNRFQPDVKSDSFSGRDSRSNRLLAIVPILGIAITASLLLFINVHESFLGVIEVLFILSDASILFPMLLLTVLLLPIITLLMVVIWFLSASSKSSKLIFIIVGIWFILRIGLSITFLTPFSWYTQDHSGGLFVFGSHTGLLICSIFSGSLAFISGFLLRDANQSLRFLVIIACLCPLIVLIWGVWQITLMHAAIDFAVTTLIFGWVLSAASRAKNAEIGNKDARRSGRVFDSENAFPTHSDQERAHPSLVIGEASEAFRRSGISVFVFLAVVPAVISKLAFHGLLGLRLDGAIASWAAIWSVALVLGGLMFAFTFFHYRRERARQLGLAAFLCAFAIMIFNWGSEYDRELMAFIDTVSLAVTMPVMVFGTLALVATVVLGRQNWSWPFWACYLFIYIFVHSMSGSGYVTDLSKLDLFSWINMSVIVFVFLFTIPVYFASDRCQPQTLASAHRAQS